MKQQTCCFTGHRVIAVEECDVVNQRVREAVESLVQQGVRFFGTGGALGFDTMAALAVLQRKEKFPHIRLILVLPCRGQAARWRARDRGIYEYIRERADKVVYVSRQYYPGCMFARNRHLVEHSQFCICYLTRNEGGTAYTVRYARQRELTIINVAQI